MIISVDVQIRHKYPIADWLIRQGDRAGHERARKGNTGQGRAGQGRAGRAAQGKAREDRYGRLGQN